MQVIYTIYSKDLRIIIKSLSFWHHANCELSKKIQKSRTQTTLHVAGNTRLELNEIKKEAVLNLQNISIDFQVFPAGQASKLQTAGPEPNLLTKPQLGIHRC